MTFFGASRASHILACDSTSRVANSDMHMMMCYAAWLQQAGCKYSADELCSPFPRTGTLQPPSSKGGTAWCKIGMSSVAFFSADVYFLYAANSTLHGAFYHRPRLSLSSACSVC